MINVIVFFIGALIFYGVTHCINFCGVVVGYHTACSQGLTLFSVEVQ